MVVVAMERCFDVDGNSGNVYYNAEVLKFDVGVLLSFNVR